MSRADQTKAFEALLFDDMTKTLVEGALLNDDRHAASVKLGGMNLFISFAIDATCKSDPLMCPRCGLQQAIDRVAAS